MDRCALFLCSRRSARPCAVLTAAVRTCAEIDKDGDGQLGKPELCQLLVMMKRANDAKGAKTAALATKVMKELDKDGSNEVDICEFQVSRRTKLRDSSHHHAPLALIQLPSHRTGTTCSRSARSARAPSPCLCDWRARAPCKYTSPSPNFVFQDDGPDRHIRDYSASKRGLKKGMAVLSVGTKGKEVSTKGMSLRDVDKLIKTSGRPVNMKFDVLPQAPAHHNLISSDASQRDCLCVLGSGGRPPGRGGQETAG